LQKYGRSFAQRIGIVLGAFGLISFELVRRGFALDHEREMEREKPLLKTP